MLGGTSYGEPGAGDNLLWGSALFQAVPGIDINLGLQEYPPIRI